MIRMPSPPRKILPCGAITVGMPLIGPWDALGARALQDKHPKGKARAVARALVRVKAKGNPRTSPKQVNQRGVSRRYPGYRGRIAVNAERLVSLKMRSEATTRVIVDLVEGARVM